MRDQDRLKTIEAQGRVIALMLLPVIAASAVILGYATGLLLNRLF